MPRESAVSKGYRIDDVKNRIPGNEDPEQHVRYIFNTVVMELVSENAGLDIIASGGGMEVLRFLDDNCESSDQSRLCTGLELGLDRCANCDAAL
jgi:hypothetical protein